MKIKINEKEYTIKFGYKATANSGILKKMAKAESVVEENKNPKLEDVMALAEETMRNLAEMLLVGLQKYHSDEFGYDLDTEEGKKEKLDLVYDLLDDFSDEEGADVSDLYNKLQNEMVANGFLATLFRTEQTQAKKTTRKKAE